MGNSADVDKGSCKRVLSILGVGGSPRVEPFNKGSEEERSAGEQARLMAEDRVGKLDAIQVIHTVDLLGDLEIRRLQANDRDRFLFEDSRNGFSVVVEVGDHERAIAKWHGPVDSLPDAVCGDPLLLISTSPPVAEDWVRTVAVTSDAEALVLAVASLAEMVLPASRSDGEDKATVRPWFLPSRGQRNAFVRNASGWNQLQEGNSKAAGSFPLAAPCHGFLLTAETPNQLIEGLQLAIASGRTRILGAGKGKERLAIVASTPEKLLKRAKTVLEKLPDAGWSGSPRNGIFRGRLNSDTPQLAWLFDGQGSQHFHMMEELIVLFPRFREWLEKYESVVEPEKRPLSILYPWEGAAPDAKASAYLTSMEGGASVAFILNLALADLLRECGVPCSAMGGHSNGENSALIAGGILQMSDEDVLQCCRILIAEAEFDDDVQGQALAVSLENRQEFDRILEEASGSVFLALDNCPHQVVLFGGGADIAAIRDRLETSGAVCTPLPFQRPFHTPWFEAGARSLAPFYEFSPVGKGHTPVFSCAHVKPFGEVRPEVVAMALSQFHMPVRFRELIGRLDQEGVTTFLEVGPGVSLKAFVDDTLGNGHSVSLSSPRRSHSAESFVSALADLFVKGTDVDLSPFGFDSMTVSRSSETEPPSTVHQDVLTQAPANGDVLQQHFSLMNEFLASQRRVFETCFGGGVSSDPTPAPRPASQPQQSDLPWPMLGEQVTISGDQLEAHRTFTIKSDPFLLDHTLGRRASRRRIGLYGIPVLPFTFSMELVAEAARCLVGDGKVVTAIEEARGHRWLAVDQDELRLRIVAAVDSIAGSEAKIRVTIFEQLAEASEKKAFEGLVVLDDHYPQMPGPRFGPVEDRPPARMIVPDFYRFGMFHGPRFQNIRRVKHLSETEVDADLQVFFLDDFFEAGESPEFQISPNLLDCAGQLTAYSMLEHVGGYYGLFPFRVETLRLYAPPPASGVRVRARGSLNYDGNNTTMDFDYLGGSGEVLFRLESKQQRCFEFPKRYHMATFWPEAGDGLGAPWLEDSGLLAERVEGISADFLDQGWGIWKRALAHMILNSDERKRFYELPEEGPRRNEWLLGRAAAKAVIRRWARREFDLEVDSADVEILNDKNGKPYAECKEISDQAPMPSLSISHTREAAVAAIDPYGNGIGLDFESPDQRQIGDWLQTAFTESELALIGSVDGDQLLPFWCAKEAAAKAVGTGLGGTPEDWVVASVTDDEILIENEGRSIPVRTFTEGNEVVAICLLTLPATCPS